MCVSFDHVFDVDSLEGVPEVGLFLKKGCDLKDFFFGSLVDELDQVGCCDAGLVDLGGFEELACFEVACDCFEKELACLLDKHVVVAFVCLVDISIVNDPADESVVAEAQTAH